MTPIEILTQKRDAAKADAERDRLSADDVAEAKIRAEIAAFEETARTKDRDARALDLARREDAARVELGSDVEVRGLMPEGDGEHTFVVRDAGSKAFNAWQTGSGRAHLGSKDPQSNKRVQIEDVNATYAISLVFDWATVDATGKTVIKRNAAGSGDRAELEQLFAKRGGIASAICLVGRDLSGAALEARKS